MGTQHSPNFAAPETWREDYELVPYRRLFLMVRRDGMADFRSWLSDPGKSGAPTAVVLMIRPEGGGWRPSKEHPGQAAFPSPEAIAAWYAGVLDNEPQEQKK